MGDSTSLEWTLEQNGYTQPAKELLEGIAVYVSECTHHPVLLRTHTLCIPGNTGNDGAPTTL